MDPLSEMIALLRPHATMSKPITGRGAWGVRYEAHDQPGFAILQEGQCWLALEGTDPVHLSSGDFVLLPTTPAFSLYSHPDAVCTDQTPSDQAVHHGDREGDPDFRMLGGSFRIEPVNASLLLTLLPQIIHIRAQDGHSDRLSRIIDLIADESEHTRPGRDMILDRLLEIMLVEGLRQRPVREDALVSGLLAGLHDPAMARALRAMHADVRHGWTVAELAAQAGMSRSVFAARFHEALGCSPIAYLIRWRMALAQEALVRGGKSLDRLAHELGYESSSAFSTAFRRRVGQAPGAFARRNGHLRPEQQPAAN